MGATKDNVHIDMLLSNLAINYRPHNMIADMVAPIVPVGKQSNYYTIFSRADILRIEDTKRAPGTEANKVTQDVSCAVYYAENYALKDNVTIEDRANADPILASKLYGNKTQFITNKLFLDWEARIANQVTSGTNVGSYAAVSSAWSDNTNSTPLADINAALDNVQDSTGVRPNRIVFGDLAWRHFRRNTAIRDLIMGTNNGGGYANVAQVRELLEVDNILVGGAYKNTGNEAQAETLGQVWADNVLVYYAPPSASMDEPSFMYSFRWNAPGLPNMQVERHPFDSKTKSDEIEVGYYQDEVVTGAEYGFLVSATNSST